MCYYLLNNIVIGSVKFTDRTVFKGNTKIETYFPMLLDMYPNAFVAYSLRRLKKDTIKPCIRIRRSVTGTVFNATHADVYFYGNEISLKSKIILAGSGSTLATTLEEFMGGGTNPDGLASLADGFVNIWYDQSVNNYDVSSGVTVQPRVVTAGVIETMPNTKNRPAMFFDGSDGLASSLFPETDIIPASVFQLIHYLIPVLGSYQMSNPFYGSYAGKNPPAWRRYGNAMTYLSTGAPGLPSWGPIDGLTLDHEVHVNPQGFEAYANNTLKFSYDSGGPVVNDQKRTTIHLYGSSNAMYGYSSETIIYLDDMRSVRSDFNKEIKRYYSL